MGNGIINNIGGFITDNGPQLLTGGAAVSAGSAVILGIKVTPKALILIEEAQEAKAAGNIEIAEDGRSMLIPEEYLLTKGEKFKAVWKCYIPTAIALGLSVTAMISSNTISSKRTAAISTLLALSESAFSNYKDEVVEQIGKNKEDKIRTEVAKKDMAKFINNEKGNVFVTGTNGALFFDPLSGRRFESSPEKVNRTVNELNKDLNFGEDITLNEYYRELGLDPVDLGTYVGWRLDTTGIIDIYLDADKNANDEVYLSVTHKNMPGSLK